mmetsp:Transcript_67144/g.146401  ORF Transcript_67144/g.146401 Transcript_67144/m.146401 type:complete len:254 (-) Transcript_67144:347-1108(-)
MLKYMRFDASTPLGKESPELDSERGAQTRAAILLKLHPGLLEVCKEGVLLCCVPLHMHLEAWILQQSQIGDQHDGTVGFAVLWASLGSGLSSVLLCQHVLEVGVVKRELVRGPGAIEAAEVHMALAHCVRTRQGHNCLVIKALGDEDLAQVIHALVSVGQAANLGFHRLGRGLRVCAAKACRDVRAAHHLNGHVGRQGPEIGIGDEVGAVLLRDGVKELQRQGGQPSVCSKRALAAVSESHCGVRAASFQGAI